MKLSLLFVCLTVGLWADEIPLASADAKVARQAIATAIEKGTDALPQLREYAKSDDPRLRSRANEAIGGITGHYGSEVDLIWKRSLKEAIAASDGQKPILMLHLFGNLDEEFC